MGLQLVGAVREYLAACEKGTDAAEEIAKAFGQLKETFRDMTFADKALIDVATERHCLGSDDEIEVDAVDVATSEGDEGVWVQAWVWVPYAAEDEGIGS